ncbi:hypothetical protein BLNAU_4689 [Blattamonas nauphoetae]|uniref:Clathrin light chain n=1 Tax=Blattamonas nauphoetae TaxID=2049346 RepID=A0ABQ9Y9Q9_9EUKA|nr:hypothetical protein BLNAU_4689 [Blattamonas nauphoetae]
MESNEDETIDYQQSGEPDVNDGTEGEDGPEVIITDGGDDDATAEETSQNEEPDNTEETSSSLTPQQKYLIEHQRLLQEKRDAAEVLRQQTEEKAQQEYEKFSTDRQSQIEKNKAENATEEAQFLEKKSGFQPWTSATDMCDFSKSHEGDVTRMQQIMRMLKNKETIAAQSS